MQLSKKILSLINSKAGLPAGSLFELPEKVLQFGTGVLLRGLPDYYIDKANKQGIFNGRIAVIKSTDRGDTDAFAAQDGLYTQCIRGISNQQMTQEYLVNAAVSRVLSAKDQWQEVLNCAASPEMEIIISNTTEVGIALMEDDNVHAQPPVSFPGKLLAFLYKRYQCFDGDANKGMIIIPTELIADNGDKLKSFVEELAKLNKMDHQFISWLNTANYFCNSLVDRIVPGKLPAALQAATEAELGYSDELMIMSEVYSLWAIETSNNKIKEKLSFSKADETVVLTDDISKYRELKLRLLNGTHTFSCGLAYLCGFEIVKDAMKDQLMRQYVAQLMKQEIAPCISGENISVTEADQFSDKVIERFSNPFIDHKWISITLNYTQKMKLRNVPLLLKHYEQHTAVPVYMAAGFAAYLLFMKCEQDEKGNYYGALNGKLYPVQDEQAVYYHHLWKENTLIDIPEKVLCNDELWGKNLSALPGFSDAVIHYLKSISESGVMETLKALQLNKPEAINDKTS
jgi:tagaturonate reductase